MSVFSFTNLKTNVHNPSDCREHENILGKYPGYSVHIFFMERSWPFQEGKKKSNKGMAPTILMKRVLQNKLSCYTSCV